MSLSEICNVYVTTTRKLKELQADKKEIMESIQEHNRHLVEQRKKILGFMTEHNILNFSNDEAIFKRTKIVPLDYVLEKEKVIIRNQEYRNYIKQKLQEWKLTHIDNKITDLCIIPEKKIPITKTNPPIANVVNRLKVIKKRFPKENFSQTH